MVKFVVDSSCDLESYEGVNLAVAPLTIYTDERSFVDDKDLNVTEMLDYLAGYNDRSYTSCPAAEKWLEAYEGGDEIYVVTLTSGLSGTYNSAVAAKDIYISNHPEAKIMVVDTLTTGPEMRIIVEKLIELKQSGKTFDEIETEINAYIKKTRLFFAFTSLHNFAQNGRVSKVVASALGMLNISVFGTASEDGKVEVTGKARGEGKVIKSLMEELKKAGYKGGRFRLCHIENESLAIKIIEEVKNVFGTTDAQHYVAKGICSYYGERGGVILGCECE